MKAKRNIFVTIIMLIGMGIILCFCNSNNTVETSYTTETVKRGTLSNSITATGTIEPVTEVEVGTQVSGIIDKIYVDYNSKVTKGQVIAEMDKITLQSELLSARATHDGNKAEYDYQLNLYNRNKALYEKQLISATDFEQSAYNFQRAKSTFEQSKASLAKAERNLSYATITSPIDGVVTSRDVEEGQTVASGFETPTLFTIAADLTKMQVVADVDEADIAGVKEGAKVSFSVDAYPNDIFEGRVEQIRLGSTISSSNATNNGTSVVTYEVVISAENPDMKLKPRLTANANIFTLYKDDVMLIPNKALRYTPDEKASQEYQIIDCDAQRKVWTLEGKTLKAHAVKTGATDGIQTEVLEGVTVGMSIVTEAVVKGDFKNINFANVERSPFMPGPPASKK